MIGDQDVAVVGRSDADAVDADVASGRAGHAAGYRLRLVAGIAVAVVLWIAAYWELQAFADWLSYDLLRLQRGTQIASAVDFFANDVPKIFLLLSGIVTVGAVISSYFPPERVKRLLAGKGADRRLHRRGDAGDHRDGYVFNAVL